MSGSGQSIHEHKVTFHLMKFRQHDKFLTLHDKSKINQHDIVST